MSRRSTFKGRLVSKDTAVAPIRSGQRVFVGSGGAEPQTLVEALTDRGDGLADTEIVHILTLGIAPYTESRFQNQFRHNAFFIGPNLHVATGGWWATLTVLRQMDRGSDSELVLDGLSESEVRLIVGVNF